MLPCSSTMACTFCVQGKVIPNRQQPMLSNMLVLILPRTFSGIWLNASPAEKLASSRVALSNKEGDD